jgi:DNA polymerase III alpha subunit
MIQLRVRTEYTFGKTFAPIPRVIERLKAIGCTAAGIVDVDGSWGHVPWFTACKAAGIQRPGLTGPGTLPG